MVEIKSAGNKNVLDWLDTRVNLQFKYGIDLYERVITFSKDINDSTAQWFHNVMSFLETTTVKDNDNDDITIRFSSCGGDVYAMFNIISRIESSPCKIIIDGVGEIQSAAVLIFAAGDVRRISKYATLMVHHIQFGLSTSRSEDVRNEVKHTDELEKRMQKFLAENTLKPASFWATTGKHAEVYVNAETAIKWGLADEYLEDMSDDKKAE